jgi:hypothetical protein
LRIASTLGLFSFFQHEILKKYHISLGYTM